jgi:cell division protein FtsW (lipid II flippase)
MVHVASKARDTFGMLIVTGVAAMVFFQVLVNIGMNLSIIGFIPWREFVPSADHPQSDFIVSTFMERAYGTRVATLFTALVLWTAFGSVFALLLGYSRIHRSRHGRHLLRVFARCIDEHFRTCQCC